MLYGSLVTNTPGHSFYPPGWLIESPGYLPKSLDQIHPKEALLGSRRNLVQLSTLCSFVLLAHISTSNLASSNGAHWTREGERKMRKGWRSWSFIGYAVSITIVAALFHFIGDVFAWEFWKGAL
jgi:dolichol kinase